MPQPIHARHVDSTGRKKERDLMKVQGEKGVSLPWRRQRGRSNDPRSHFRNRLLVGIVAVALLPLLAFAVLAAVELDAVSRSTAQATQSAILQDQQHSQGVLVAGGAKSLDSRANEIAVGLSGIVDKLRAALAATPATTALPSGLSTVQNGRYSGGSADPTSLVVSASAAQTDGRFAVATSQVVQAMAAVRQTFGEIVTVWVADNHSGALRTDPGFDVPAAVIDGRIDFTHLGFRDGVDVFGAASRRMSVSAPGWAEADPHAIRGQSWTDPYALVGTGITGISVWIPVENGADPTTVVGADILMPGLVDTALTGTPSGTYPAASYPMLLSSSGAILYAGSGIERDFQVPADPVGAALQSKPTSDPAQREEFRSFAAALHSSETAGSTEVLQTHLSKVTKFVFTSPVATGHWMWARAVPLTDLEPDLTSLIRGVTTSIHRLFPVMVLPVLLLLLGLAFAAATVLSRRMELPVRALTDHAVLEERTRLAREIHDTLAQQLTGIVLELEAANTLLARGSDRARRSVEVARDLARSALQEARRSVWNLRPAPLAATGVVAAIDQEVEGWQERTGIPVRFKARSVPPRPSLQPAAEVALLRIVQEALTNTARHSAATSVDVSLRASNGDIILTVHDNGVGFDDSNPRSDCFGLTGMRERAHHAGGTLAVVATPGSGTTVTARIPLSDAGSEAHTA
jgi:signal transduction histidine kinase